MKKSVLLVVLAFFSSLSFSADKTSCPRDIVDLSGYAAMVRENLAGLVSNPFDEGRDRVAAQKAADEEAVASVWRLLGQGTPPQARYDIPREALVGYTGYSSAQIPHFVLGVRDTVLDNAPFFTFGDLNTRFRAPEPVLGLRQFLSQHDYGGLLVGPLANRWAQARGVPRVARVPAASGTKPLSLGFRPVADQWSLPDATFHEAFLGNTEIMAAFVDDFHPIAIGDLETYFLTARNMPGFAEVAPVVKEHYLITDLTPIAATLIFQAELSGSWQFVRRENRPTFRRNVERALEESLSRTYPVSAEWVGTEWTIRPRPELALRAETPVELEDRVKAFLALYRWSSDRPLTYWIAVPSEGMRVFHLDEAGAALETILVLDRLSRLAGPQTHARMNTGSLIFGQRQGGPVSVRVNAIEKPDKSHLLILNGMQAGPNSVRKAISLVTYASWLLEEPERIIATEERLGREGEDPVVGNLTGALLSAAAALQRSPSAQDRWIAEVLLQFARSMQASAKHRAQLRDMLTDFLVRYSVAGRLVPERFQEPAP